MQLMMDGSVEQAPTRATPQPAKPRRLSKTEANHFRELEHAINPSPWTPQIPTPDEEKFRHSAWTKKRAAVRAAMSRAGMPYSRLTRFDCCGSGLNIEYSEEEKRHRVIGHFCHDRHCEPCMRSKANIIAKNLRAKIEGEKCKEFRFITLTLKHTDTPLAEQIKRLLTCFRKLRTARCWRASQHGGSASLEIKWSTKTRQWHPHLHIISDGKYLEKETLSAAWHHATGDSFVTDIRKLRDAKEAAYYVSKYASKGVNAEVWSDEQAAEEWLSAMQGVRTCGTWGTWRGYRLTHHDVSTTGWKHVGTLTEIIAQAKRGITRAVHILMNIVRSAEPEEVWTTYKMDTGDG
jgi:hypothetical protein